MDTETASLEAPISRDELVFLMELRLSWLTYLALSMCVQRLLQSLGYEDVRHLGRMHLRGRTKHGGIDMSAKTQTPLGLSPVLIQVKRYHRAVSRRFVDELRGSMLRYGAPHGVLITTSTFSKKAIEAASSYRGRPVTLIDGKALATLMVEGGLGIDAQVDLSTGTTSTVLDARAFEALERACERTRSSAKPQKEER